MGSDFLQRENERLRKLLKKHLLSNTDDTRVLSRSNSPLLFTSSYDIQSTSSFQNSS